MLSILTVVSITELGPIIFLRLAEKSVGEYDAIFSNRNLEVSDFLSWYDSGFLINYSQVKDMDLDYNLSPRMQFCGSRAATGSSRFADETDVCIAFIDTDQEDKIKLGTDYPFKALDEGECLVPKVFKTKGGLKVDDTIVLNFQIGEHLKVMVSDYIA